MATKHQVFDVHRKNPSWTAAMIADALRCDSAYVRSTFYRAGLRLPGNRRVSAVTLRERERCAAIAEKMGAGPIAAAIRRQH